MRRASNCGAAWVRSMAPGAALADAIDWRCGGGRGLFHDQPIKKCTSPERRSRWWASSLKCSIACRGAGLRGGVGRGECYCAEQQRRRGNAGDRCCMWAGTGAKNVIGLRAGGAGAAGRPDADGVQRRVPGRGPVRCRRAQAMCSRVSNGTCRLPSRGVNCTAIVREVEVTFEGR